VVTDLRQWAGWRRLTIEASKEEEGIEGETNPIEGETNLVEGQTNLVEGETNLMVWLLRLEWVVSFDSFASLRFLRLSEI
jgi:hypothetical protein